MAVNEVLIELDIEELEEGGYLATSKALPGLVAQGRTIAETMEIAEDVARKLIESYVEHGEPLPFPVPSAPPGNTTLKVPVAVGE